MNKKDGVSKQEMDIMDRIARRAGYLMDVLMNEMFTKEESIEIIKCYNLAVDCFDQGFQGPPDEDIC